MTDRNRELVPDNWSLVRERALATGLGSEKSWRGGPSADNQLYQYHQARCPRTVLRGGSKEQDLVHQPVLSIPSSNMVWGQSLRGIKQDVWGQSKRAGAGADNQLHQHHQARCPRTILKRSKEQNLLQTANYFISTTKQDVWGQF